MAGPGWLCLNGYLRCISYSQSPPTLHYAATVDSIFKRFLGTAPFCSFSLFHSFSHPHTHTHTYTRMHTHRQECKELSTCLAGACQAPTVARVSAIITNVIMTTLSLYNYYYYNMYNCTMPATEKGAENSLLHFPLIIIATANLTVISSDANITVMYSKYQVAAVHGISLRP
jgi:hypothetical protein